MLPALLSSTLPAINIVTPAGDLALICHCQKNLLLQLQLLPTALAFMIPPSDRSLPVSMTTPYQSSRVPVQLITAYMYTF